MKPLFMRRPLGAALLLAALLGGAVPAAAHPSTIVQPANAHEQALQAVLIDTRVLPITRAAMLANPQAIYHRKLLEHFGHAHRDEDIAAAFARQAGASVSVQDGAAALRVARLAPMRAMMRQYEALAAKGPASLSAGTPDIKRLGMEIDKLARPGDMAAMQRLAPLSKRFGEFYVQMVLEHDKALGREFLTVVVAMARLGERDDYQAAEIPRERTGFAPTDGILDIFAESLERIAALNGRTTGTLAQLELDTLLEARHLVDRAGIARSRTRLGQAEQVTQEHLSAFEAIYNERSERVRAAMRELPSFSSEQLDARAAQVMEFLLKLTEHRQRQFAVFRRMLDFAESRVGQTELAEGKLLFASDADVDTWRAMLAQLEDLEQRDSQTVANQLDRERQMIDQIEKKR